MRGRWRSSVTAYIPLAATTRMLLHSRIAGTLIVTGTRARAVTRAMANNSARRLRRGAASGARNATMTHSMMTPMVLKASVSAKMKS